LNLSQYPDLTTMIRPVFLKVLAVMAEERINSRAQEQQSSRAPVQNIDVDMDEDHEEEEWHLNAEDDDIQDKTDINMDETEDAIDVEKIVKEW
jgi:hypothetical protein